MDHWIRPALHGPPAANPSERWHEWQDDAPSCLACRERNLVGFEIDSAPREFPQITESLPRVEASRAHDAVISVYDQAGKLIEVHKHKGDFKEW